MPTLRCQNCGAPIKLELWEVPAAVFPGVHGFCQGCKLNHIFFGRFCPGIPDGEEWTTRKCEGARQEAHRRYDEYVLNRGWRQGDERRVS